MIVEIAIPRGAKLSDYLGTFVYGAESDDRTSMLMVSVQTHETEEYITSFYVVSLIERKDNAYVVVLQFAYQQIEYALAVVGPLTAFTRRSWNLIPHRMLDVL